VFNKIDHIVYCVYDLEESIDYFENEFGIKPIYGGRHLKHGTKNALINLGDQCYLELLTIDKSNEAVTKKRWMGIDLLTQNKITRWAMTSQDLINDKEFLTNYNTEMGELSTGSRMRPDSKELRWEMTLPLSQPEVELVPFLINWSQSESHPTDGLSVQGRLLELRFTHPNPASLESYFAQLEIDIKINTGKQPSINAIIQGPNGNFEI
jgi:hypothetical protein